RYGNIHIRFGEPISMAKALPRDADPDEHSIAIRKIAFDVMVHIGRVTPITPTAAVCIALLSRPTEALTVEEITAELRDLTLYVYRRRLPTTERVRLDGTAQVREVLGRLTEHNIVTQFRGQDLRYRVGEDQHLAAAYYRNVVIHFFVNAAIAEVALDAASGKADATLDTFWESVMALRELLKFEFFFAPKDEFRAEIRNELSLHDRDWETLLADDHGAELLASIRPLTSGWVLRPFLEGYLVVADELTESPPTIDEKDFLGRALARGKTYKTQGRIAAAESISQVLFTSALGLAANRGLLDDSAGALDEERTRFAAEIRQALETIDRIEARKAAQQRS
ncbi:MAG: glycerol-3-phosphate acyltransferase, partial [Acidimicrobiia bacterium]|nr:glycerol-3-phosphate acyltransferase [Acidimicrobiia bacterium]